MGEGLAAHVAAHGHLDEHGVAPHDPDGAGLRQYGPQIAERVGQQALQGVLFNELVHGVALEERQGHVHQRRHAVEEQHEQEGPLVAGEEGQHALPGGEAELLGVIQLVISIFLRLLPDEPPVVAAHLYVVDVAVDARAGDELLVGAYVGHVPVGEHQYALGLHEGGYAVGDEYHVAEPRFLPSSARILASVSASTAERESSNTIMGAFCISMRAMATRCFCPPESVTPRSPTMVP